MMPPPIIITGAARSGTSMTAGIIDHCGGFGGRTLGGSRDNPKGFFENLEIREHIIKPYLMLCGADPLGQKSFPEPHQILPLANLREKIETVMKFQGYRKGRWYFKGAKALLVWQEFHKAFPDADWIIVRRNDADIVNSCLKTGFMCAYRDAAGWQGWVDHHKKLINQMKHTPGLRWHEVWPTKFIDGDFSEVRAVVEKLGLKWKEEAVRDFVDPKLWSSHGKSH